MKRFSFKKLSFAPEKGNLEMKGFFAFCLSIFLLFFCWQMRTLSYVSGYVTGGELVMVAMVIVNVLAWRHFLMSQKSFGDAFWTVFLTILAAFYGLVTAYPLLPVNTVIFWAAQMLILGGIVLFLRNSSILHRPQAAPVTTKK